MIYNQLVQAVIIFIITLRTKKEMFTSCCRLRMHQKKKTDLQMNWFESHVSSVLMSFCMHRACLPMQSSTDGRVGGWVLSAHRSSCGSVVPLLFTTQARRACQTRSMETYQGWMLCFGYAILQCLP